MPSGFSQPVSLSCLLTDISVRGPSVVSELTRGRVGSPVSSAPQFEGLTEHCDGKSPLVTSAPDLGFPPQGSARQPSGAATPREDVTEQESRQQCFGHIPFYTLFEGEGSWTKERVSGEIEFGEIQDTFGEAKEFSEEERKEAAIELWQKMKSAYYLPSSRLAEKKIPSSKWTAVVVAQSRIEE
jgi:hypothetical protein